MIYPSDFETRIGFDLIRTSLRNSCKSPLGKREVDRISFSTDKDEIAHKLDQIVDFISLSQSANPILISDFFDPENIWPLLKIEDSYLDEEIIYDLSKSLKKASTIFSILTRNKEEYPALSSLDTSIHWPKQQTEMLNRIFDEHGKLWDQASKDLFNIRKRLREEQGKVRNLINRIFKEISGAGYSPEDSAPTLRNGRVVIPVKSEHKRKVKGFVHDESATGQTAFIEPSELLELNNEIRDIEIEERREIVRILRSITNDLRGCVDQLVRIFDFLGKIDCVQAKAKLGTQLNGIKPILKNNPQIRWTKARHPILTLTHKKGYKIVPLTIELSEEDRILLVSGPNAGGKSVCLKTVGLIQYMVQCGLIIPVQEDSIVGIFQSIFLDIGDQQSIENDLSTYSSHLESMNFFTRNADSNTLILIDEMGSGTDPNFGGGISEAVLKGFLQRNVWGVITTHYYNLKVFASEHTGIRNAAMRFDTEKLKPLFELEIGRPGNSFALEIARKIGLPKEILDAAEQVIGKELVGLETIMQNLMHDKQEVEKKLLLIEKREELLERSRKEYEQLKNDLENQRKEIIQKAKKEASILLDQTNKQIEKTIRHIRESKAEKKETRKVRDGLTRLRKHVKPDSKTIQISTDSIHVNDTVRIIGQEVSGIVLLIKGKMATVSFGDIRTTVKVDQLVLSSEANKKLSFPMKGINIHTRRSGFNPLLDVRGKKAEEVISILTNYIDEAVLLDYREVKILHGKGEGILRKIVREQLKSKRQVKIFKDESVDRGGDGITLVELK